MQYRRLRLDRRIASIQPAGSCLKSNDNCERLTEWMAIEKDENSFVFAFYAEIVVDMKLPGRREA